MPVSRMHNTTEEWEKVVGEQIRTARIASELDQAALSELANVSIGALSNLERGRGSSLTTVVAVVRALGRTDWLESLAPKVTISPLQMLRSKQKSPVARARVRKSGPPSKIPYG
jgi:transcriptional regulator with XRE-family HTH domain